MIILKELLQRVTEKDIMEHYWGCALYENKPIYKNPMRKDSHGTCYFKWSGEKYYLVDRAGGWDANFDCFKYVRWFYNCSFYEALYRINADLNVELKEKVADEVKRKPREKRVAIKLETRKYKDSDLAYWNQFGISARTLAKFKVYCVNKFYTNSKCSTKWELQYKHNNNLAFAYVFDDRVKIYQPYSTSMKWRSNTKADDIFGLDLLPKRGNTLYIASGCKDAMCLYEMGYDVIAPQSESASISPPIMEKLKKSFKEIIVVFDNDATGIKQSELMSERHGVSYVTLPNEFGKDVAEIVNQTNLEYTSNLIENVRRQKYSYTAATTTTKPTTNSTAHATVERFVGA